MFAKSNKVNQEYIKFENAMKEMMNKSLNDKHIQMIRRNKQLQLFIKKSFLIESIKLEEDNIATIKCMLDPLLALSLVVPSTGKSQIKSFQRSIKLANTKMSLMIYLHNGNKSKVIEKKESLNKKHLDMLDDLGEDGEYQLAMISLGQDVENYYGEKSGENYRRFAEGIRKFNMMITNCEKCLL